MGRYIAAYHPDLGRVICRYLYEPKEIKLTDDISIIKKKQYNHSKHTMEYVEYITTFATFDIETTTIVPDEYKRYIAGELKDYSEKPYAYMYIWQMCVDEDVVIGRTWSDLVFLLDRLRQKYNLSHYRRMVIYVHFLAYETQFIQSFVDIYDMFAKDVRKPLKYLVDGFEFRCSYFLSNMNLRKFCENSKKCVHYKLKDEFDYSIVRTPKDELSDLEYLYCYCDVKGLHECIETLLIDDTIATIPMTSTGYVRRDARRAMGKNKRNFFLFRDTALTLEQYDLLTWIFRGGDTHASRFYSGMVLYGLDSFDFKSSYPFVMLTDYFPIGKFYSYDWVDEEHFRRLMNLYCVIFQVEFKNIRLKNDSCSTYIDIGHVRHYSNIRGDNGRVLAADYIQYACTEIDFKVIDDTYIWDDIIVTNIHYAKRGKLPDELKEVIRDYFRKKTELDGIEEYYYEYAKSKNKLNALFGMIVSAIIHDDIVLDNGNWSKIETKEEERRNKLLEYYNSRSSFLPYQWGVYVTAHARSRLNYLRSECERINRDSPVYWDTDSLKCFVNDAFLKIIEIYNKGVRSLNESATRSDGVTKYLGVFEREKGYERFKTLGAKKYAVEQGGDFKITVAGLGKETGARALLKMAEEKRKDVFDLFDIGTVIHESGRTTAVYNDDVSQHYINVNGIDILAGSNVAVINTTYEIGVTEEYYEYIINNRR